MKTQLFDKFITTQKGDIESKEKEIESRGVMAKLQSLQEQVEILKAEKVERTEEYSQGMQIQKSEVNKARREFEEVINENELWKEKVEILEGQL